MVRIGQEMRELAGREENTSANRLHRLAVVRGLEALPAGVAAHVYTPSAYVAQGGERWARMWARSGWRTKDGPPVKHSDLWQAVVLAQEQGQLAWPCLRGQTPRPGESARADELARQAAR